MNDKTIRALLIEGDPEDALLIHGMLGEAQHCSFDFHHVASLAEGIKRLSQATFDVLLLDLSLPDSQGLETFTQVNRHMPHVPVIMLSGLRDESVALKAVRAGAQDYLVKGRFDSQLLARAIRYAISRKELQSQLVQAQKLESIGQLAAGIAHEINTPTQYIGDNTLFLQDAFADLNTLLREYEKLLLAVEQNLPTEELLQTVKASAETADVEYLSAEIPNAIGQTLEGIERVQTIVRAMKEFSHPGSKEKMDVDLNKAIQITTTVAGNAWKYVADLEMNLDPSLPLVPCMLGEINQVILNLIVNAAHAIGDVVGDGAGGKGRIIVRTQNEGDWVEIRLSDTGAGIPADARDRIFEPFFTTKEVGKGTGQGLAIAHSVVVEKHGGSITFETESGKGTTFIIRLPLNATAPTREAPHEADSVCR